ncbi:hypothetical protein DF3PB_600012 [uncultured Defluviicoccus sp.]|uniref:Uncharacterized protein n=1 Tax=metagenome TaxID=256318 RepID=A0A380TJ69_9ZZZZ|nr:hypothetical protein DF3PB_600012 [uncultured Defluviicoccus sp.]
MSPEKFIVSGPAEIRMGSTDVAEDRSVQNQAENRMVTAPAEGGIDPNPTHGFWYPGGNRYDPRPEGWGR